jgi:Cd2+/Zn2+-exporting ATPase
MSEQHNTKSHKEANHHTTDDTSINASPTKHTDDDGHKHDQITTAAETVSGWKSHWHLLLSLSILIIMLVLEFGLKYTPPFPLDLIIYLAAYFLGGYNVLFMAFRKARRFDFFNEFFLMSVATIGAFAIGSYSEGVAVMIFYSLGEWFQDSAVTKAKRSIKALLDIRP